MDRNIQNFALCIALVFASCSLEGDVESLRPRPAPELEPVFSAPGVLTVLSGDGMITVRWAAVEEALSYEVYIGTGEQPPALPEKTVPAPSTTTVLDGLTNKTIYYIWIKAKNGTQTSGFSPRARGIPWPVDEIPDTPGRPVIVPGINQLTVNWEETGGATSYEVYINTAPSTPSSPAVAAGKTSAVINNLENDIIYYVWVRAANSVGKSGYSPVETGTPRIPTVAPAAPAMPVLVAGNRELAVSWQAVELAASYEVWFGTAGNSGASEKFGSDVIDTEAVITGLTNEVTYYVWIKAKNIIGASGFSPPANAKPSAFAVLPETPEMPEVTPGSRELNVSWQAAEGALSYELWIGETDNPANAEKHGADISGTSMTLNDLLNNTTYYIWLKAKNDIGESGFSPMASGTPSVFAAPPSAPQAAPTISVGSGQLAVSWQAAEGAAAYEVWAGTTPNPTTATKRGGDVSGLSAVVTGLTNGTTYYVWIKAKNSVGESGFSPLASGMPSVFSVAPQAPSAPAVSIGNGQITVTWAAVEGTAAYEIWLGTSNNSASAAQNGADESASLSRTINGLTNGTTYYVWIKANNSAGTSGFSPAASGKPIANAAAPTLTAANEQLSAAWAAIAGADQYEVFYGTGLNPPQTASQTVTAPATTATMSGLTNGTSYNVWVRGRNLTGTGAMSAAASARPIGNMGAVTLVSGNNQLTANWSTVAGADQYEVYCDTTNAVPASPAQTVNASATTATITGLTNGTTYYVFVIPKNAHGAGSVSAAASGAPMATPGALTVSAANQQITLNWAAVLGAASYEVYYSTTTTIPVSPADTAMTPNHTFTGLSNGTTYYFWVKAVNANGVSAASPAASGKPVGNMGAVTVVSGNEQLTASWAAVAGADEYEVYFDITNAIPANPAQTVNATTATISGLSNGTTYYVWVKPKNANGVGAVSASASGVPMATPGALTISVASQQVTVSWAAVPGATSYEIYQSTSTTIPASPSFTVTETSRTITGLTNGTTYYYWVKAVNASGTSGASPRASGKPVGNMGAVTVVPDNNQLSLSWTAVAGADQYEVYYSTSNTIPSSPAQTVSATTATINELTNGTTYYVWVIPKNANGAGGTSVAVSGMPTRAGLYKGSISASNKIGNQNLSASFTYISANAVSGDNYFIVLAENESASGITLNYSGKTVGITLIGEGGEKTIFLNANGSMFTINAGVTLTLDENVTLVGRDSNNGSLVNLVNSGSLIINDGAKISENTAGSGGGIYINDGTFTMNGGTISGNIATYYGGGGIYISNGTFIMNGGTISGNTANAYDGGGGIYISNGTFIMNGGTISGNIASGSSSQRGGGIYSVSGTITIYDGSIRENITQGVYIRDLANFTMHNGLISKNTYGGIHLGNGGNGSITMYGGTISGNSVGVYIENLGSFTMHGGIISGNGNNGVLLGINSSFTKIPQSGGQNSGIVYGAEVAGNDINGVPLKHNEMAVYRNYSRRSTTAGQTDHIDTSTGMGLSTDGNPPYGQ